MNNIKVCSQNIQGGLEKKFAFDDVNMFFNRYDIVLLQETWLVESSQLDVKGFSIFRSDRGSHKKRKTGSGGVITL